MTVRKQQWFISKHYVEGETILDLKGNKTQTEQTINSVESHNHRTVMLTAKRQQQ